MNDLPTITIKRNQLYTLSFQVENDENVDFNELKELLVASISEAYQSQVNQKITHEQGGLDIVNVDGIDYTIITINGTLLKASNYVMDFRVETEEGNYHILSVPIKVVGDV